MVGKTSIYICTVYRKHPVGIHTYVLDITHHCHMYVYGYMVRGI